MSKNILTDKKVVVLMGGPGAEREVSLRSGQAVAEALSSRGIPAEPVDVVGTDVHLPDGTDFVFNMIHGTFGEDGGVQDALDRAGVPYTGEGAKGSRLAFDKILTKHRFQEKGIPTAEWAVIRSGDAPPFDPPLVLKAPRQGSSVGVHIIKTPETLALAQADCLRYGADILVEKFFVGRELTVGILGDRALPVIEIVAEGGFYDYAHKYTRGATNYFVPAPLEEDSSRAVQEAAQAAHQSLGLEVYSRVDVLLGQNGAINVMEINTIPGMTETSLLPKAAAAVGISFPDLCLRIAEISLSRFSMP